MCGLIPLNNYSVSETPTSFSLQNANMGSVSYHLHMTLRHKCFSLNDPFPSWAHLANMYRQHLGFRAMKLFTAVLIIALL